MIDKERIRAKEKHLLESLQREIVVKANAMNFEAYKTHLGRLTDCFSRLQSSGEIEKCTADTTSEFQATKAKNHKLLAFIEAS